MNSGALLAWNSRGNLRVVTAAQIISEIRSLTPEEQAGVVRLFYEIDAERKLSGPELSTLADRLVQTDEASRIRESISRGFYGADPMRQRAC